MRDQKPPVTGYEELSSDWRTFIFWLNHTIITIIQRIVFFPCIFSFKVPVIGVKMSVRKAKMVQFSGVSRYPGWV